jgi:DNA-binding MarR family transcriptional regulator
MPSTTDPLIRALERLAVGSVAITERAIASAGTDLTFVQWRVLLIVGEQEGGVRVGEIAERIGAHASPTSRLISRLKSRGVVMTEKDELDGRATRVRLTSVGRTLRGRVLEHRRQDLATVAPKLELTPGEVTAIGAVARVLEWFA